MTREEFKSRVLQQLELAERELEDKDNALDLRAGRSPYNTSNDLAIFCTSDLDDAYNFINGSEEWYVDLYENFSGENYAEYIGRSVVSWE